MTTAAYLRTSSKTQEDANGTAAQRHAILKHAGDAPLLWFVDGAQSGKSMHRPEWDKLVAAIHTGEVKAVLAYSLSRIGRNTRGVLDFVDLCRAKGVKLVFLRENIDTETTTGRFFLTVLAALAEMEREVIADRVSSGLRAKGAKGERWGRNRPRLSPEQADQARAMLGTASRGAIAAHFGMHRNGMARYLTSAERTLG